MKITDLILTLFTCSLIPLKSHAESLSDLIKAESLEWMVGKWASDDGNVSFSYTWKLDRHALGVTFKMGDSEAEGMIMLKPGSKKALYGAVDNKGGMTVGEWSELNDHPLLITKHTSEDGSERKMAVEYIKVDDDNLTVKLYGVGADGKPDTSTSHEASFKRQK